MQSQWKLARITGKNLLLPVSKRKVIDTGWAFNSDQPRIFDGKQVIIGLNGNNMCNPNMVTYRIEGDAVTFSSRSSTYGFALDVQVLPDRDYAVKSHVLINGGRIRIGMYDAVGNFITQVTVSNGRFHTGSSCYWITICCSLASLDRIEHTFGDIQLETGNTNSAYEPYTEEPTAFSMERCKGGYMSSLDAFGLRVAGRTIQDGTPDTTNPIPIQCVKAGTQIHGSSTITVPCHLYEGDSWFPATGKVERNSGRIVSYNGENVPNRYISTTGALTTGAEILYPLTETLVEWTEPQPIITSTEETNVYQTPVELEAGLSGMLMVRR